MTDGAGKQVQRKILVFLDSDVVIRHFVHSAVLQPLTQAHNVLFVFPDKEFSRIKVDLDSLELGAPLVRVTIPEQRRRIWRLIFHIDQMKWRMGYGWPRLWLAWWKLNHWKACTIFTLCNFPGIRKFVDRWMEGRLGQHPATEFKALLDQEKPEVMVHPSTFDGYFINDFVSEGQQRGIPTILLMNSWDNPSIKRAMSGHPDWVAVWGEQTAFHTSHFLGVPRERIVTLGAAQFEVYRHPPRVTREEFCREHGIDPKRKVLLYAGSSKGSPESRHLSWLDTAIESGVLDGVEVLYRPHPWGISKDEADRILTTEWKHVFIERTMRDFLERLAAGTQEGFLMAEYSRTHDILSNIDALISPLSTIILEAAIHGHPVMCMSPREEAKESQWKGLNKLVHFEDMFNSPAVVVCERVKDFIPHVVELMSRVERPGFKELLANEMKFFVEFPEDGYSASLLRLIDRAKKEATSGGSPA